MIANKGADKAFNIVVNIIMGLFGLIILVPLIHVLASSFSSPQAVYTGKVRLWPVNFSVESYKKVFQEQTIWRGYANTLLYTVVGTVLTLFLQMTAGYPLSRKDLKFRGFFTLVFIITMFVGGGLIPSYLVMKNLKLLNTGWAIILPSALAAYNVIIVRTFISTSIPWELQEAAMIDGCGSMRIFWQIIVPLSKPILAVMCLYSIVGYWNSYFNALIYVTDVDKQPLQMVLRKILVSNEVNSVGGSTIGSAEAALLSESLKYSTIVVSCAPILFLYPFFEKYFEKGMIVGSLKG